MIFITIDSFKTKPFRALTSPELMIIMCFLLFSIHFSIQVNLMEIKFQRSEFYYNFALDLNWLVAGFMREYLKISTTGSDVKKQEMFEVAYIAFFAEISIFLKHHFAINGSLLDKEYLLEKVVGSLWWEFFRTLREENQMDVTMKNSKQMPNDIINFVKRCASIYRANPGHKVIDTYLAVHLLIYYVIIYLFDLKSNERNFGFQEQFTVDDVSTAIAPLKQIRAEFYDIINRIFTSAYDECKSKCEPKDIAEIYRFITAEAFVNFFSSIATTMLDYAQKKFRDAELLKPMVECLIAILPDNGFELSSKGLETLQTKTSIGVIKVKSVIVMERKRFDLICENELPKNSCLPRPRIKSP